MKFGVQTGKKLSGAGVYTYVFQAASLLPLPYMLIASGYTGLAAKRGVLYRGDFGADPVQEPGKLLARYGCVLRRHHGVGAPPPPALPGAGSVRMNMRLTRLLREAASV